MAGKICLLLILSLAALALAQEDPTSSTTSTEPPTSTTNAPTTSTSAPTTSTSAPTTSTSAPTTSTSAPTTSTSAPTTSTSAPTTSTSAPTTSTSAPTTSTSAPTTSTSAPTTSTSAPTTSTSAPTTSTSAPTTSTSAPTTSTSVPTTSTVTPTTPTTTRPSVIPAIPSFPNNFGKWNVTSPTLKSPCIMLKGALQLHVDRDNKSVTVDVPSGEVKNVHVSGNCNGSDEQNLRINWWSSANSSNTTEERNNTLVITFEKQEDEKYSLSSITYYYKHGKHVSIMGQFFETNLKHSYVCNSILKAKNETEPSFMLTQDLQFQAFRKDDEEDKNFGPVDECKADNRKSTGLVLGIAVGVGLLIILVISLGIYLVKRYKRGGYQPLGSFN